MVKYNEIFVEFCPESTSKGSCVFCLFVCFLILLLTNSIGKFQVQVLNIGPHGRGIFKTLPAPPTVVITFRPEFLIMFTVTVHINTYLLCWKYESDNLKKKMKFDTVPNWKITNNYK